MNTQTKKWYVRAYEVGREYGGAEEGGWWYDAGSAVTANVEFTNFDEALAYVNKLREEYPRTGRRSSVLGGEDYDVDYSDQPLPDYFPEFRPFYE
jgi:hypothetical protein